MSIFYLLTYPILSYILPNQIILSKILLTHKRIFITEKLDQEELVSFKELLISNSIQIDAVTQLMIEKGFFTKEEFFEMIKRVQMEYKKGQE